MTGRRVAILAGAVALLVGCRSEPVTWRVPMHDVLLGPYYVAFVVLLCALILMNLAWYAMFWRMLYRLAQGDTPAESGDAVYEGDGARAIGERKRR